MKPAAIRHRLDTGRLRRTMQGVYVVGRPDLDAKGVWMAAVLSCGPHALLSHRSAASLWRIRDAQSLGPIDVLVIGKVTRKHAGIRLHRRLGLRDGERREADRIPVTDPTSTLVDIAPGLTEAELERAVNEAVQLGLVTPDGLRSALRSFPKRSGVGCVRRLLDRDDYAVTATRLEQRFMPIAAAAGLPRPQTQVRLNGYRVDFYWPELGMVVEADSLRFHRTAAKQAGDQRRDQVHTAAGLTTLRFAHRQVFHEEEHVRRVLAATARRLRAQPGRR